MPQKSAAEMAYEAAVDMHRASTAGGSGVTSAPRREDFAHISDERPELTTAPPLSPVSTKAPMDHATRDVLRTMNESSAHGGPRGFRPAVDPDDPAA